MVISDWNNIEIQYFGYFLESDMETTHPDLPPRVVKTQKDEQCQNTGFNIFFTKKKTFQSTYVRKNFLLWRFWNVCKKFHQKRGLRRLHPP